MRTRARSARLPRKLLRGQKLLDGISGEEIYQRSSSTRYQRGMYMHKKNYDYLTTAQMEDMLITNLSSTGVSFEAGQGNEMPNYSNLPTYATNAAALRAGLLVGMPYLNLSGQLTHVT